MLSGKQEVDVSKGVSLSDRTTWWWNKAGFSFGAQETLNGLRHLLTAEQASAVQGWISEDLRAWSDAADESELGADRQPPAFPKV
jgi:hypothetical protein